MPIIISQKWIINYGIFNSENNYKCMQQFRWTSGIPSWEKKLTCKRIHNCSIYDGTFFFFELHVDTRVFVFYSCASIQYLIKAVFFNKTLLRTFWRTLYYNQQDYILGCRRQLTTKIVVRRIFSWTQLTRLEHWGQQKYIYMLLEIYD